MTRHRFGRSEQNDTGQQFDAAKRAAATKGSAVSSPSTTNTTTNTTTAAAPGSKKHKSKPTLTPAQIKRLDRESTDANANHQINEPSPIYRPMITPGNPITTHVGYLSPDRVETPSNKYRFVFHYNPAEIDFDTQVNINQTQAPKAKYTGGARNIFAANTTMSFQFMISRQEEVAAQIALPVKNQIKMQYGSNLYNGVKATNFRQVGTLYDIEYLYLAINGPPGVSALGPKSAPATSAPYILGNALYITFGKSLQFYGYVTDLSINHIMFSTQMVPIVTYVQISANAYSLNNPYASEKKAKKREKKIQETATTVATTVASTSPSL